MIGVKLIDAKGSREMFLLQRNEFWIAVATAATIVVLTVMDGIALAVILSLIDQVRHAYRARTTVIVKDAEGRWQAVPAAPNRFAAPGGPRFSLSRRTFFTPTPADSWMKS